MPITARLRFSTPLTTPGFRDRRSNNTISHMHTYSRMRMHTRMRLDPKLLITRYGSFTCHNLIANPSISLLRWIINKRFRDRNSVVSVLCCLISSMGSVNKEGSSFVVGAISSGKGKWRQFLCASDIFDIWNSLFLKSWKYLNVRYRKYFWKLK